MSFEIRSESFKPNHKIPIEYTGEGTDMSPPLSWGDLPEGTKELALICDDPDAPMDEPFVHWVVYNIPPETRHLPEAVAKEEDVSQPVRMRQGQNSFGYAGYGGPMPPKGHGTHHYHFKLYALDQPLNSQEPLDKARLLKQIEGHILAQAELVGTYERQ